MTPISGLFLDQMGFDKIEQGRWEKGSNIITYDGCWWKLNGSVVYYTSDIESRIGVRRVAAPNPKRDYNPDYL